MSGNIWQSLYEEKSKDLEDKRREMELLSYHYGRLLGAVEAAQIMHHSACQIDIKQLEGDWNEAISRMRNPIMNERE